MSMVRVLAHRTPTLETTMSKQTEEALHAALQTHLRDAEAMEEDELLVAWVVSYAGEIPTQSDVTRFGHSSPDGQRYYVSHGLAAGLMAAFNAGVGSVHGEPDAD